MLHKFAWTVMCVGGSDELVHFKNDYSSSGDSYRASSLTGKRTKAQLSSLVYF